MSIIINTSGFTYKHREEAKVGDLWIGLYNRKLVAITNIYNTNNGPLYIEFQPIDPDLGIEEWHGSRFYSTFEKYDTPQKE